MSRTRTIQNEDGTTEIVRVLDSEALITFKEWNPIAYEASIVWLEDVSEIDFVRFMLATKCTQRRSKLIPDGTGRILGYSRLMIDAPRNPEGLYTRRIFFRFKEDEGADDAPKGSVSPATILPGVMGQSMKRKQAPTIRPWKIRIEDPRVDEALKGRDEAETRRNREACLGALMTDKGEVTVLLRRQFTIGRDRFCDLSLTSKTVSAQHCRMTFDGGTWYLIDLGSTSGTWINGERILANVPTAVTFNDHIAVAGFQVTIQY